MKGDRYRTDEAQEPRISLIERIPETETVDVEIIIRPKAEGHGVGVVSVSVV